MDQNEPKKVKPWIWPTIVLILAVVIAYFLFSFNKTANISTTPVPASVPKAPTQEQQLKTNTDSLDAVSTDLEGLNNDFDQLNKIDTSASEDVAPTL